MDSIMDLETQKDLHLLYTTSVDDIRFTKKQQWQYTYYALMLMAGIAYLMKTYPGFYFLGDIFIGAIAIPTILLIDKAENDIVTKYRPRIKATHKRLSNTFQRIVKLHKKYTERIYGIGYFLVLFFTVLGTALLLIFITPIPH